MIYNVLVFRFWLIVGSLARPIGESLFSFCKMAVLWGIVYFGTNSTKINLLT